MSRKLSLRRELFYKNIDVLLTSNSLHTVEEEYEREDPENQVSIGQIGRFHFLRRENDK